jgi:hypothetical protein
VRNQAVCPRCQKGVHVPDQVATDQLTCPRCLLPIDNPRLKDVYCLQCHHGWSLEDISKDLRCPICNPKMTCPHCGKDGESYWLICPYCEGAFGEKSAQDKRLERLRTLLQFFGGLGLLIALLSIFFLFIGHEYLTFSFSFIGLLLLGLASLGITVWQTQDNPSQRTANRYLENFLLVMGFFVTSSCFLGLTYVLYLTASGSCSLASRPAATTKKPASKNIDKVTSEPSDKEPKE